MKNLHLKLMFSLLYGIAVNGVYAQSPELHMISSQRRDHDNLLWYDRPAANWYEALPIGNGHVGAMVFGDTKIEHIQLNESTLWSGGPYQPAQASAFDAIKQARTLIFQGTPEALNEANNLLYQKAFGRPVKEAAYLPLGDLQIKFRDTLLPVSRYRRALDLNKAIVSTSYTIGKITYQREIFADAVSNVIVVRFSANRPGKISFTASFASPLEHFVQASEGRQLTMMGKGSDYLPHNQINNQDIRNKVIDDKKVSGVVIAHARLITRYTGGSVKITDEGVTVLNANAVTLIIGAATNYVNPQDVSADAKARTAAIVALAKTKSFVQLKKEHLHCYQSIFKRVKLNLGHSPLENLPTNQRIGNFAKGLDPGLAALYYQFGRYLLLSCSRPGGQPANLQGMWSGQNYKTGQLDMSGKVYNGSPMQPAWGSKYTTNINTEMNYWLAETANLSECTEPLFKMISELSQTGAVTAKTMYGARGWVLHHNTDLWRGTAPVDYPPTGMWATGAAWLCTHIWEHYQFTGDKEFLKKYYPIMKSAALFFTDFLAPDPNHPTENWMVTCPAYSPENGSLCAGPAMDNGILHDLFTQTAKAAAILNIDDSFQHQITALNAKLPPFKIGKWGQFQEWMDDIDRKDDHNRHVSQLYALFPSNQVTAGGTPELFEAAKVTLNARGDAGTGWSLAWKINFWARLLDGDHAYLILSNLLDVPGSHGQTFDTGGGTYPNLMDAHPPFQIDGNFGAVSGMTEMLLQSMETDKTETGCLEDSYVIHLLPALPKAWPIGSVTGLRARGAFQLNLSWNKGALVRGAIRSMKGNKCRLLTKTPILIAGVRTNSLKNAQGYLTIFSTKKGMIYQFKAI